MITHTSRRSFPFLLPILCLLLAACSPLGGIGGGSTTPTTVIPTHAPTLPPGATKDTCPASLSQSSCQTPHSLRVAYGVESLVEHGFTGKGQTVVDIVSFGSPTLQKDMDMFDQQFGLPPIKIVHFDFTLSPSSTRRRMASALIQPSPTH